jgi:hypothetical protein
MGGSQCYRIVFLGFFEFESPDVGLIGDNVALSGQKLPSFFGVDVKGRFELEVTFAHPQKHSVSSV